MSNEWFLTETGIYLSDGTVLADQPFIGRSVRAGASGEGKRAVIVDASEIWVLEGSHWECQVKSDIKLNCLSWASDGRLLVGTEKARLAYCADGTLVFNSNFDAVPDRSEWITPWGGPPDTRSIAISRDGAIYVNIHVGWIVRSTDNGSTWVNLKGMDMDVHQVCCAKTDSNVVFTATADGFFISRDCGDTFVRQESEMPYYYQRACTVVNEDEVYLVSTSKGPRNGCNAKLYWSDDTGLNWTPCAGLPDEIASNINTFQVVAIAASNAVAVIEDRDVYKSEDSGRNWSFQVALPSRCLAILT